MPLAELYIKVRCLSVTSKQVRIRSKYKATVALSCCAVKMEKTKQNMIIGNTVLVGQRWRRKTENLAFLEKLEPRIMQYTTV